ncbi:MAG TPA: hypothetical protein PKZ07_15995 [Sedimentisphaerales bacterium]|nr:hypothetical protein [Sedimentisphaerales bacterium]
MGSSPCRMRCGRAMQGGCGGYCRKCGRDAGYVRPSRAKRREVEAEPERVSYAPREARTIIVDGVAYDVVFDGT